MTHSTCRATPLARIVVAKMTANGDSTAGTDERRVADRRRRRYWGIWYGGFRPRRRGGRRLEDAIRFPIVDWHASHLLAVAVAILLLCVGDAALTVALLSAGAVEVNPVMAVVIGRDATLFAAAKTTLTGAGIVCLVAASRYRFFRALRVELVLYVLLAGYAALIGYEFWLLRRLGAHGPF